MINSLILSMVDFLLSYIKSLLNVNFIVFSKDLHKINLNFKINF